MNQNLDRLIVLLLIIQIELRLMTLSIDQQVNFMNEKCRKIKNQIQSISGKKLIGLQEE